MTPHRDRWKAPRPSFGEATGVKTSILLIVIVLVGVGIAVTDLQPNLSHLDNRVLSGSAQGEYHQLVDRLATAAAAQGGRLVNVSTQGSVENAQRLAAAAGTCSEQFALVQAGLDWSISDRLQLIGRLEKAESVIFLGANAGELTRFDQLRGKRIGIGASGSGSALLARQVLTGPDFAPLNLTLRTHPMEALIGLLERGEIDLAVLVIDEDAALVRRAVRDHGMQLAGFEHVGVVARQHDFARWGVIRAGQYDPIRVLPPEDRKVLRVDTLLIGNQCASRSQTLGLLKLVSESQPGFIRHNRETANTTGLPLAPAAAVFFEGEGIDWLDAYVPWLGDIMPPSNWVHVIFAVSILFNLMGLWHRFRLWRIDAGRVEAERLFASLFGEGTGPEDLEDVVPSDEHRLEEHRRTLESLITRLESLSRRCRRQSLSVLVPMGAEMAYRYQERLMSGSLTHLRRFRRKLAEVDT